MGMAGSRVEVVSIRKKNRTGNSSSSFSSSRGSRKGSRTKNNTPRSSVQSGSSSNRQTITSQSGSIYGQGSKFRRFSSGQFCPVDDVDAKPWVRKITLAEMGKNRKTPESGNALIRDLKFRDPSINSGSSSSEIVMCQQSFQSQQGMLLAPSAHPQTVINNNSILNRTVPSAVSIGCNEDKVLSHLIGNYNGPDKMSFATEIVQQVQDLADLSTESIVAFLMSKEYQSWVEKKTKEWNRAKGDNDAGKSNYEQNPYTMLTGEEVVDQSTKDLLPALVEIFQEGGGDGDSCVGVQNHYNYEIKINMLDRGRAICLRKCCIIL